MNELKTRADEIRNGRYILKLELVGSSNKDVKRESIKDLFELEGETTIIHDDKRD